jgi:ATP-dependent phosphoenolpyruvate carboxykinase
MVNQYRLDRGAYGTGSRMKLKYTRSMITAAQRRTR